MAWAVPCKGCSISSFPTWTLLHFNSKPENRSQLSKWRSNEEVGQAGNTQTGCGMSSGLSPDAGHGSLSPLPLVPISVLAVPLPFHPLWEPRPSQPLPSLWCTCPASPLLWFPALCSPPLTLSLQLPCSPWLLAPSSPSCCSSGGDAGQWVKSIRKSTCKYSKSFPPAKVFLRAKHHENAVRF